MHICCIYVLSCHQILTLWNLLGTHIGSQLMHIDTCLRWIICIECLPIVESFLLLLFKSTCCILLSPNFTLLVFLGHLFDKLNEFSSYFWLSFETAELKLLTTLSVSCNTFRCYILDFSPLIILERHDVLFKFCNLLLSDCFYCLNLYTLYHIHSVILAKIRNIFLSIFVRIWLRFTLLLVFFDRLILNWFFNLDWAIFIAKVEIVETI